MWPWVIDNWQFVVGTIVGIIGVLIAVFTILYQRDPKQLDYEIRLDFELHSDWWEEKLAMGHPDLQILHPWMQIIRIRNTGKKSISEDDFVHGEPISVAAESTILLDRSISGASDGINPKEVAKINEHLDDRDADYSVRITPKLLNPGDWFDVQVLSNGWPGYLTVTARFADQRRPMRRTDVQSPASIRNGVLLIIGSGCTTLILMVLTMLVLAHHPTPMFFYLLPILAFLPMFIGIGLWAYKLRKDMA
jgi:hypothetical protein